jgi:hypothetical protein
MPSDADLFRIARDRGTVGCDYVSGDVRSVLSSIISTWFGTFASLIRTGMRRYLAE